MSTRLLVPCPDSSMLLCAPDTTDLLENSLPITSLTSSQPGLPSHPLSALPPPPPANTPLTPVWWQPVPRVSLGLTGLTPSATSPALQSPMAAASSSVKTVSTVASLPSFLYCDFLTWSSLSLLDLWVNVFSPTLRCYQQFIFHNFFCFAFVFPFLLRLHLRVCCNTRCDPRPPRLFIFFFFTFSCPLGC